MKLEEKLKAAKAKRQEIVDQVNAIADEIDGLKEKRLGLLEEALRYDGEVRTLVALIKEEEVTKSG